MISRAELERRAQEGRRKLNRTPKRQQWPWITRNTGLRLSAAERKELRAQLREAK